MPQAIAPFPKALRIAVATGISALVLAYLAAPLFGISVQMPVFLEVLGGGTVAGILGLDYLRGGKN